MLGLGTAAAVGAGAKILGLAKGLVGGAKAAGAIKAAAGLGAKGIGPMTAKTAAQLAGAGKGAYMKRMAGEGLKKAGNLVIGPDLMNPANRADLMFRLAPDAAFGLMGAAMTPGDLGDKAIAGTTQFLGGGLTGIAASRGAKAMGASQRVADMVDMGGSVLGDFGGMAVGDGLMRIKGGGETPYEKQAKEQDELYRAQIMQELKQQYGLV